jgi:hypothetical protein
MYDCDEPGFPLAVSDEWILCHAVLDFHLNGYKLLRLRDVQRVRWWGVRGGYHRILKEKGIPGQLGLDFNLDITSIQTILTGLKCRAQETVLVYFDYERPDALHVGRPLRVGTNAFTFATISTNGTWDEPPARIIYENVYMIEFRCEYGEAYGQFAGPRQLHKDRSSQSRFVS